MKRLVLALLFTVSTTAAAQYYPHPEFQRVLVPVYFFGGGAGGAAWWTNFDLVNTGPSFRLGRALLQGQPACPELCGCDEESLVEQWNAQGICPIFEGASGLILHVPRNVDRDEVFMNARVLDTSRVAERAGTEIPVVWEDDLLESRLMLLDVRIGGGYRATLRLFDAFQWDTEYGVIFYDMAALRQGERKVIFETRVQTRHDGDPGELSVRPSFAIIGNLQAQYPQLAGVESVAIEILPSEPIVSPPAYSRRHYALASITNDTTQEVTIVSPR